MNIPVYSIVNCGIDIVKKKRVYIYDRLWKKKSSNTCDVHKKKHEKK